MGLYIMGDGYSANRFPCLAPAARRLCQSGGSFLRRKTQSKRGSAIHPEIAGAATKAIVTSDDNIVLKDLHTPMIRRRIGVEPVELPGGHCPFVSRPGVLARVMDGIVA
jgi:hypothetical protein